MNWQSLSASGAQWIQDHPSVRRIVPLVAAAAAFLLFLAALRVLVGGPLDRHFARSDAIAFEVFVEAARTSRQGDALDGELLHATQALEAVQERAVFRRGPRALVLLRVARDSSESSSALAERVVSLLPPHVLVSEPVHWPLVPKGATLFRRFGEPETKARFESDAAQAAERWLAAGDEGIAKERLLDVVPQTDRLGPLGVTGDDVKFALERGLGARPPLPRLEPTRVVPSTWERATRTPSEVASRILSLSVERADGLEIPLVELATLAWTWAPQRLPSPSLAPEPPQARPWLTALAHEKRTQARTPWATHWTREDLLLAGGLFVAALCLGIVTVGTIAWPVDALFLVLFLVTFSCFFVVSPLAVESATPQGWLLLSAALVWASLRLLPWRLSRDARAGWSAAQILLFAGVFVALAFGFLQAPDGGVAAWTAGESAAPSTQTSEGLFRESGARILKDGLSMGSRFAGHHEERRPAFSKSVATETGVVHVRMAEGARPVATNGPSEEDETRDSTRLHALRNGSPGSFAPDISHLRSSDAIRASLAGWMLLTLAAAAFSAALLGGGFARWATLVILQTLATLTAGSFSWVLQGLSVPLGLDVGALQLETLVAWSVALSSVCLVWLDARTRQLQARQMDTVKASRIARRQLLRTALSLLACATLLWPTVLLLDRFVSAAVLSTFWLACAFLFPCVVATLSHKIVEAIHYRSLFRRVRRLSLRMAQKGHPL